MGMIRFIPVAELNDPLTLSIGLSGGSGTGKTYTALLMARGIAETVTGRKGAPIGYVDTENRRALHYKAAFPEMCHYDFTALDDRGDLVGFGPERWIAVIDAAEAAELPVLILDSFSHAWEGVGGVLDLHATTLERLTRGDDSKKDARSQLAWAEVKPRYRRLIDRIVRAKTNIIICTRAKPVMQDLKTRQNARNTKTRRKDVPWDPASDGDLLFEMTTMVILDPSAPGCPVHQIKVADQFKALLDPRRPMGVDTGRAMADWAKGQGEAQKQKELLDLARSKAREGSAKFTAWWQSAEGKDARPIVRTILADLQALAEDADRDTAGVDDDPFASAAQDDGLTPAQRAEMEAAEAAFRSQQSDPA
ncbi:ATP-binding protein [Paracoccus sp. DMF]|uniref:ATP-binding protein n=1 Tax=Paracoccus sp. DMF TaxID=400837 RepID=UPI0021E3590D|nr:ATP-binding protein [Paracoccus sp. DMF]MCV2449520.1 ATP-binding protein [Paracoccus sp. DMF]